MNNGDEKGAEEQGWKEDQYTEQTEQKQQSQQERRKKTGTYQKMLVDQRLKGRDYLLTIIKHLENTEVHNGRV